MSCAHADMHVHLDQFADPVRVARDAAAADTALFCATTTPSGFEAAHTLLADAPNVRVGAGLHPWWIADGRCSEKDIAALERLVPSCGFVGEIGLDFLEKHTPKSSWAAQFEAFTRIARAAAASMRPERPKVLTIHSVRATATTLAVLRDTGCLDVCVCILHWFSDSTELLWDAIRAGCYFSFGERSLATGKGREYVKLIPPERLLFETDMPWPSDAERGFVAISESLARAESKAAAIIGAECVAQAHANAAALLAL